MLPSAGDLLIFLRAALLAVGSSVPWKGLLLAYGAGQLAANLPITPGGLGAVEGSITIALVAFGGGRSVTVEAVLLYHGGEDPGAGGYYYCGFAGADAAPFLGAFVVVERGMENGHPFGEALVELACYGGRQADFGDQHQGAAA